MEQRNRPGKPCSKRANSARFSQHGSERKSWRKRAQRSSADKICARAARPWCGFIFGLSLNFSLSKTDSRSLRVQERPAWISKMQSEMPEIPEFRPTEEEFADPLSYIRSIAAEGAKFVPLLFEV